MGRRNILIQKFLQLFQLKNLSTKTKYLLIVALVALLLLILGNGFMTSNDNIENHMTDTLEQTDEAEETISKDSPSELIVTELEESYEKDLQKMLNNIQGVSEVEVMVNLDSTNIKVYETNLIKGQQITNESDTNGGIRKVEDQTEETQVVLVRQGDQEVPLLVQTEKPKVRGVFVVAKGVDHSEVKMWVIEAVSRVLDVPSHKVSVMPMN